jgi:hypothetical protein
MAKIARNFKNIHLLLKYILSYKCLNHNILKVFMIEKQKQFLNFVKTDKMDFFIKKFKV